jgi:hypothetical protein
MSKILVRVNVPSNISLLGNTLRVSPSLTVAQLQMAIRRRIRKLNPQESIFLFWGKGALMPMTKTMAEIFHDYGVGEKLEVSVKLEETFG